MVDDVFTRIVSGEIPSHKVYEDEYTLAFLDIKPVHPGHTLVVPKAHYRNILDVPEDVWVRMAKTARLVARAVSKATGADGINLVMNNEPAGHQVVFYAHIHIIPRFVGDGIKPWPQGEYAEGEAEAMAETITRAIG